MLVAYGCLTANMVLLLMMTLLWMMLLMRLVLILLCHIHLHIPLMDSSSIHHHMLALLVRLVEHTVGIVIRRLRDWRPRWRRGVIAIASSGIIDRRSVPREMAMMMVLLVMLRVVILPSPGLLEPIRTICHRMNREEEARRKHRKHQPSLLGQKRLMGLLVVQWL